LNAWELEKARLRKKNINFWSVDNEMINFTILPVVFVLVCFVVGSIFFERVVLKIPMFFFAQSFFAFSLLEVVNYLEHYGMERKLLDTGFYERVTPIHSWNASHVVSNFLFSASTAF
jgi:alkane 1-monooxygenase